MICGQVATYQHLRTGPLWRLLADENAPVILAVIEAHLPAPRDQLERQLERDLIDLRRQGFDLPKSASDYIVDWINASYLENVFESGQEEIEPSGAGQWALRIAQGLGWESWLGPP